MSQATTVALRPKRPIPGFYDERSAKRQALKIDLHISYVGRFKAKPPPKKPPRSPRWTHRGPAPLNDLTKVPDGWHDDDSDIDPEDFKAMIERCDERIQDNILPYIWRYRKKIYVDLQAKKDAMIVAEPGLTWKGLTWEVVQRLDSLKGIEQWLVDRKDDLKLLETVASIKKAYRSGTLAWNDGLVTYWSHGKQISQPRPFVWDEFRRINKMYDGHQGFWVEGLHGYKDPQLGAIQQVKTTRASGNAKTAWTQNLNVCFRFLDQESAPGVPAQDLAAWIWHCRDDTGADFQTISSDEMQFLQEHTNTTVGAVAPFSSPAPPLLGVTSCEMANSTKTYLEVRALQVTIHDDNMEIMLPDWVTVQVAVIPGSGHTKLIGPWLRHALFTATTPDQTNTTWIFNQKGAIDQRLPNANIGGFTGHTGYETLAQYNARTGVQWPNVRGPSRGGAIAMAGAAGGGGGGGGA